jgi:uncharacterized protein YycO
MAVIVRFVEGTGLDSSIIKFHTYGPWSHVEFYTPQGYIGARLQGGVALRPFGYDSFRRQEFRQAFLNPAQESQLWEWVYAQIGKKYDWQTIAGMAFHRDWRQDDCWICSEMVAAAFAAIGAPILRASTADINMLTPRDIGLSTLLVPCPVPPGA